VTTPLQRVLFLDFLGAGITALVMIGAASALEAHLGVSADVLRAVGLALLPFVSFVLLTARSDSVHPPRVHAIVGFNLLWLVGSLVLLMLARVSMLGAWIVVLQALLVPPLVFFELRALRSR
jgi:hypothetical protein